MILILSPPLREGGPRSGEGVSLRDWKTSFVSGCQIRFASAEETTKISSENNDCLILCTVPGLETRSEQVGLKR